MHGATVKNISSVRKCLNSVMKQYNFQDIWRDSSERVNIQDGYLSIIKVDRESNKP